MDNRKDREVGRSKGAEHNRRDVLLGATSLIAASVVSAPALIIPGRANAAESLVVTLWGGQFTEFFRKAYLDPFTKETGIEIIDGGAPDLAKVKAMVQTRNIEWDVVLPTMAWMTAGERDGLWEPIDYSIVDMTDAVPGLKREYGMCYEMVAGSICWNTERNGKPDQHPKSWVEFFDANKVPGRRGLRSRVSETLELALLGDGVNPKNLYPLDVDRAFKALDRIKPHVSHWISATPQTITLVQRNECDFTYAYNGRVYAAQAESPIDMARDNYLIYVDYATVVKGTKKKNAAMRLLSFIMRADRQAAFADLMPYGPVNVKAAALTNPKVQPWFANPKAPNSVILNPDFWADKEEKLTVRFKEWLATS